MGKLMVHDRPYSGGKPTHIYSTDEQKVGVWIDGKTIYEKTYDVQGDFSIDTNWRNFTHNIANIDSIIQIEAILHSDDTFQLPAYRPGINTGFVVGANKTYIKWINNWIAPVYKVYVTLRYTKST